VKRWQRRVVGVWAVLMVAGSTVVLLGNDTEPHPAPPVRPTISPAVPYHCPTNAVCAISTSTARP